MAESSLVFVLHTPYFFKSEKYWGCGKAHLRQGRVSVEMEDGRVIERQEIIFTAEEGHFSVQNVTIGVDFHWEKKEQQTFQGHLKLIPENGKVRLINVLDVEDYLCSNISSEMRATSSEALLKAHAVVSRSWLLAQLKKRTCPAQHPPSMMEGENERIKWYDRENHSLFDVCADDHCQRYQGITRIISPLVKEAVEATRGLVLTFGGKVCDARYSKSCGGVSERFETCWEDVAHPYLQAVVDSDKMPLHYNRDLTKEKNAERWILNRPSAFCAAQGKAILRQVLNDYDWGTTDFYRWKVKYTQQELAQLLKERSGLDFGNIINIEPLSRGTSGRIYRLKIQGSQRTFTFGKELEIRKVLSSSHLYSSAFVVRFGKVIAGIPETFTFVGAGWGHGVGLCQIGAAVMAERGYDYKAILQHYFKEAKLVSYSSLT